MLLRWEDLGSCGISGPNLSLIPKTRPAGDHMDHAAAAAPLCAEIRAPSSLLWFRPPLYPSSQMSSGWFGLQGVFSLSVPASGLEDVF